ncbi:MAG: phosphatidate cytidylyltransferase, partial [Actinobacteria bacterium]|nr:phosphatidate cytidylyltransferase [Actinomycetota bacterium]
MTDPSGAQDPAPVPSRAGRNLPAAIASGVVLALLVVVSLVWIPWLFGVLAAAALCLAIYELTTAFAAAGIHAARTPVYATTVVGMAVAYVWGTEALLITMGA